MMEEILKKIREMKDRAESDVSNYEGKVSEAEGCIAEWKARLVELRGLIEMYEEARRRLSVEKTKDS